MNFPHPKGSTSMDNPSIYYTRGPDEQAELSYACTNHFLIVVDGKYFLTESGKAEAREMLDCDSYPVWLECAENESEVECP